MSDIYFSSDHHFYHHNIIKYCNRPFHNVDEMNSAMITKWNEVVKPNDFVYYLGDFAFAKPEQMQAIFSSLNGTKILAGIGNHDNGAVKRLSWSSPPTKFANLLFKEEWHYLSHYPTDIISEADTKKFKHKYYFHGHCHGTGGIHKNKIDVGVDCWGYSPIIIEQLIQTMKERPLATIL